MQQSLLKKYLPGIAWFFVVLILICIPGYDLPETDNWLQKIHFDKIIHIGIFGLLSLLFHFPVENSFISYPLKNRYHRLIAFFNILYGITTEVIQHFLIPGRSFDLGDWAADVLGALLALAFIYYWRKRKVKNNYPDMDPY